MVLDLALCDLGYYLKTEENLTCLDRVSLMVCVHVQLNLRAPSDVQLACDRAIGIHRAGATLRSQARRGAQRPVSWRAHFARHFCSHRRLALQQTGQRLNIPRSS